MANDKISRVQETIDRLCYIIMEEHAFKEGERLPNEFKLAASLNIGRSTLREAIAYLKEKGIVESRKGSGTYVVNSLPAVSSPIEGENAVFHLRDLIELRLINEPYAIALAARRALDEEMDEIIQQGEKVADLIVISADRTVDEQTFHELIFKATGNRLLINMIPLISKSIEEMISCKRSIGKLATDTKLDIHVILDTLRQRDAIAAKNAMENHIHHIVEALELNKGKYPLYDVGVKRYFEP